MGMERKEFRSILSRLPRRHQGKPTALRSGCSRRLFCTVGVPLVLGRVFRNTLSDECRDDLPIVRERILAAQDRLARRSFARTPNVAACSALSVTRTPDTPPARWPAFICCAHSARVTSFSYAPRHAGSHRGSGETHCARISDPQMLVVPARCARRWTTPPSKMGNRKMLCL